MAVIKYEDFPTAKVVDTSDKAADFNYKSGYKAGYADAIHKACKWIEELMVAQDFDAIDRHTNLDDFRKAMED